MAGDFARFLAAEAELAEFDRKCVEDTYEGRHLTVEISQRNAAKIVGRIDGSIRYIGNSSKTSVQDMMLELRRAVDGRESS